MKKEDCSYFEQRAEKELELAQKSEHPKAVRAHYQLAGYYLDLVHSGPGEPNFVEKIR